MAKNLFNTVKYPKVNTNVFDLSHDVKLTMGMGTLVPVMVMDCVPGDKVRLSTSILIRFAPLIAPVMHIINAFIHYFFVPNRLVWPNWEDFITTGEYLSTPPAFPFIVQTDDTDYPQGSLGNYLGLPVLAAGQTQNVSAIPFAAYQFIYNEYYRDENLVPEVDYLLTDGDNTAHVNDLRITRRRAWEHDYFTAALPFAQKGQPVTIPVGSLPDMRVRYDGNQPAGGSTVAWQGQTAAPADTNLTAEWGASTVTSFGELYAEGGAGLGATTINDLRVAYRLQEWLEKNARGGTRYIESMLVHFGVKSSDARLNRPEYITGSKSPVVISEVLNTTGETGGLPQGNMAGHGLSVNNGKQGSYYCEEHGYIIGIMSVLPKTAYQQGTPKHFLRNEATEWYWPTFANLGEQPILNREVMVTHSNPDGIFGYIPRYAEYKYIPSRTAGEFMTTLSFWTFTRQFFSNADLNQQFIECNPILDPFAVTTGDDKLWCHVYNDVQAVRKMPKYGTPTF